MPGVRLNLVRTAPTTHTVNCMENLISIHVYYAQLRVCGFYVVGPLLARRGHFNVCGV